MFSKSKSVTSYNDKWVQVLIVFTLSNLFVVGVCQNTQQSNESSSVTQLTRFDLPCIYAPGLQVGNATEVQQCCQLITIRYRFQWSLGRAYLTTYLQSLRSWGCPQFEEECRDRVYAFTEYSRLMYEYYCNYTDLVHECFDVVNSTYVRHRLDLGVTPSTIPRYDRKTNRDNVSLIREWRSVVENLESSYYSIEELTVPCMQVALYEAEEKHIGEYHEIVRSDLPSCGLSWCGIDAATLRDRYITPWDCLPSSCRAKLTTMAVICGFLAALVTVLNLSVILVYINTPAMLHSQGIYKVSLAVADVLIGLIVFPTFISSLYRIVFGQQEHGQFINVTGFEYINETLISNVVQVRAVGGTFNNFLDRPYLNAVGFFTGQSVTVSIYTLIVAGFDRLRAVYRPLSYRKDKAKKYAKITSIVVWIAASFFSILPTFVSPVRYRLVASVLVSIAGERALILYVIALAIPILVMWIINGATLHFTQKHARAHRHLTIESKKKTQLIEVRLAKTLSIMVGAFTASILPAAVVIFASLFTPSLYPYYPRQFNPQAAAVYSGFEFAVIVILACNSVWNFFIYNARNREFRKALVVTFKRAADTLGLITCYSKFTSFAQTAVDDGRQRFSSLPNLASSKLFLKKSSVAGTFQTTLNSSNKLHALSSTDLTSKTSRVISSESTNKANTGAIAESSFNSHSSCTHDYPDNSHSSTPSAAKKKRTGKTKQSMDDSIFQSFAVDANADRLYLSVMERVEEVVVEDNEKQNV